MGRFDPGDRLERWGLACLGGLSFAVTVVQILASAPPLVPMVALRGINVVFSVLVVLFGLRLARSDASTTLVRQVTKWGLFGGAILTVLAVWAVVSTALAGTQYPFPSRNVTGGAMVGVLAGSIAGYYHERSKQRARELAELRGRRLEDLASLLSHDLQSPLDVAHGRLRQARSAAESDRAREHLADAEAALARMDELVEDTLALVGRGGGIESVTPLGLRSFVTQCWGMVEAGDAELVVEGEGTFEADRGRAATLFENLLANAVEHGAADGEDVTITVGTLPDGFYVEDDGPGIPEDERSHVFELGYAGRSDGHGLGLAIVEEIATEHAWDVDVTEGREGGARFEITGVDIEQDTAADGDDDPRTPPVEPGST